MTVQERRALLEASVAVDPTNHRSRRFALRRGAGGLVEIFDVKWTQDDPTGEPVFHGHPASKAPRAVLKHWRDAGLLEPAEYKRLSRELPGC
jgi:hypothetical protein